MVGAANSAETGHSSDGDMELPVAMEQTQSSSTCSLRVGDCFRDRAKLESGRQFEDQYAPLLLPPTSN